MKGNRMSKITVRNLIDDLKLKEIISPDNKAEETYITEKEYLLW